MRAAVGALLISLALTATFAAAGPKRSASWRVLRTGTNRTFAFGGVSYLVKEMTSRERLFIAGTVEGPPTGSKFVTVWYEAMNTGQDPIALRANWFYLRDGKGRRYAPDNRLQWLLALLSWRGAEVNLVELELPPGVKRGLLTGFVLPDDALQPGARLRIYFPADGKPYDFIEVWLSDDMKEQDVTEGRDDVKKEKRR